MKKSFVFAAIAATVVASCAKESLSKEDAPKSGMIEYTTTVSFEQTKSYLDGRKVVWEVGDKVAIFDDVNAEANEFSVIEVSAAGAKIQGQIAQSATTLWGVYPFCAAVTRNNDEVTVNIANVQTIKAGKNIDENAIVSYAKSAVGEGLAFKNVVSFAKFSVSEDNVKSVSFTSKSNVKVAGKATYTFIGDSLAYKSNSGCLAVTAEAATTFEKDKDYYITLVPAGELSAGFGFVFKDTENVLSVKESAKSVTFPMNGGFNFGSIAGEKSLQYTISNKEDLATWAANARYYLPGDEISLTADIDCGGDELTPADFFRAKFNGNNHSIYNFKVTASKHSSNNTIGIFANVSGSTVIKDLKIGYDPNTSAADGKSAIVVDNNKAEYAGALAGLVKNIYEDGVITLSNISNYAPVKITLTVAGTATKRISGIVGGIGENTKADFISCTNHATVLNLSTTNWTAGGLYVGGILGQGNSNQQTNFIGCENYGEIELAQTARTSAASFAGGIIARLSTADNSSIKNCTNEGLVHVTFQINQASYMGGIIGMDNNAENVIIEGCVNKGEVKTGGLAKAAYYGGIAGVLRSAFIMTSCSNSGAITKGGNNNSGGGYGGIVGMVGEIKDKVPTMTVTSTIKGCTNTGYLTDTVKSASGKDNIYGFGGIVGQGDVKIEDCTNSGSIKTISTVSGAFLNGGGIIGFSTGKHPITGCVTSGTITSPYDNFVAGGIVGKPLGSNGTTGNNCQVNATLNTKNSAKSGLIIGEYSGTDALTFGTATEPVTVAGSVNGTAVTAENVQSLCGGSVSKTAPTFNVVVK